MKPEGIMRQAFIWSTVLLTLQSVGAQVTNFTLSTTAVAVPTTLAVAVADVNRDGHPDLIGGGVGSGPNGGLLVSTNDGTGHFHLSAYLSPGDTPNCVVAADVNADGSPDLVYTCLASATLTVLTNNGAGQFTTSAKPTIGISPAWVAVADLNGDGRLDLVCSTGTTTDSLTVFTNAGGGTFGSSTAFNIGSSSGSFNFVVVDINQDGRPDLVCPNADAGLVGIWINQGNGTFVSNSAVNVGASIRRIAVADVNRDGKPDLICVEPTNGVAIWTNDGVGGFQLDTFYSVVFPFDLAVGDVNGDGRPDIVCCSPGAGLNVGGLPYPGDDTLTVLTNDGAGGFGRNLTINVGAAPTCVVAADVNQDGFADLVCPANDDPGCALYIYTNTVVPGHTGFSLLSTAAVGGEPFSTIAVDVNRDDRPDLVSAGGNVLTVLTNNGKGRFSSSASLTGGSIVMSVAAADVNGDGWPDLVSADWFNGRLTVWTNDGRGILGSNAVFTAGSWIYNSGQIYSLAAADVNGDGKPDLIQGNWTGFTVWTNNGSGGFGSNAMEVTYSPPNAVAVVDINGDGKPDVMVSSGLPGTGGLPAATNGLIVFTNDGAGGFGAAPEQSFGPASFAVAAADLNGDGWPDLVAGVSSGAPNGVSGNALEIWTNNGDGSFGSNRAVTVDASVAWLTVGDVNGDSRPDLIAAASKLVSGSYASQLVLFTNNGSGQFGAYAAPALGSVPRFALAIDVNGDGRTDLVAASARSGNVTVLAKVPVLDIGIEAGMVRLTWPYSAIGFELQGSADLGANGWSAINNPRQFRDGGNKLLLPFNGSQFYRLRQP